MQVDVDMRGGSAGVPTVKGRGPLRAVAPVVRQGGCYPLGTAWRCSLVELHAVQGQPDGLPPLIVM